MAIRHSLFAALSCIGIVSGCSSSTTTAGKSPDDEVRELIAKVKSLPEAERQVQGPGIGARLNALRDKTSDATKKEIDTLMSTVGNVHAGAPHGVAKLTPAANAIDVSHGTPDIKPTESDASSKAAPGGPELAPAPREVKK